MEEDKQIQGERLQEILFALNIKQKQFCDITGIQQSHMSNAVQGKKGISFGLIEKMIRAFPNVNTNRIITGDGPVLLFEPDMLQIIKEPSAYYGQSDTCTHLDALRQRLVQSLAIVEHIIANNCQK